MTAARLMKLSSMTRKVVMVQNKTKLRTKKSRIKKLKLMTATRLLTPR